MNQIIAIFNGAVAVMRAIGGSFVQALQSIRLPRRRERVPVVRAQRPNQPQRAEPPALTAARRLGQAVHADRRVVQFRRISREGTVEAESEVFSEENDSLIGTTSSTMVPTVSNAVVKPELIKVHCAICKGFDVARNECAVCHRGMCGRCYRDFEDGVARRKMILCPRCHKRAIANQDTWAKSRQR